MNENTNGLIRQYLPKGTDFNKLTDKQVLEIMDKLNNRPQKCLGYKTLNQVFFGIKPPAALARIAHRFSDFGVFRRRDLSEATRSPISHAGVRTRRGDSRVFRSPG